MFLILLIARAAYVIGFLIIAWAAWRAPEGREDHEGFHTETKSLTSLPKPSATERASPTANRHE
jgi:hypothetical protein